MNEIKRESKKKEWKGIGIISPKPNGYWSEERIMQESLKYKYRSHFEKGCPSAYRAALSKKIIDKACSHMEPLGNRFKRMIYVYEFPKNKSVYVGLTFNLENRHNQHLVWEKHRISSSVFKFKEKTQEAPVLIKASEYINVIDAIILEAKTVNIYKKNGWNILNKAKTGNIRSHDLHSKDSCRVEALKYKKRFHLQKGAKGIYKTIDRNNWWEELCSHMLPRNWTKERCKKQALKFDKRIDFFKFARGAYNAAWRNKWLDDVCRHMQSPHP